MAGHSHPPQGRCRFWVLDPLPGVVSLSAIMAHHFTSPALLMILTGPGVRPGQAVPRRGGFSRTHKTPQPACQSKPHPNPVLLPRLTSTTGRSATQVHAPPYARAHLAAGMECRDCVNTRTSVLPLPTCSLAVGEDGTLAIPAWSSFHTFLAP